MQHCRPLPLWLDYPAGVACQKPKPQQLSRERDDDKLNSDSAVLLPKQGQMEQWYGVAALPIMVNPLETKPAS
jgi:hypothetical protein